MLQADRKGRGEADRPAPEEQEPVDPNQTVLKGFETLVKAGKGHANRVRELRLERMMSKAELARRAGLSPLTITRVEEGYKCRLDTKRKILEALGLSLRDRHTVFHDEEK
jgi:DNA-binding XRE family transcriptional regulator